MRVRLNDVELYVDTAGSQLRVDDGRLIERPTILVVPGGPGFDQGYLRPGLDPLAAWAQLLFVDLRRQGRSGRPPVDTCTLEQMADDLAELCIALGLGSPVVFGHSAGGFVALHLTIRHPEAVGGLILCDTAPTLAPLPDDDPPLGLADRAPAEAVQIAGRLFGGDFSPETFDAFERLVAPYYAGPTHIDVPGQILPLSTLATDVASHFFGALAGSYDLRPHLAEITAPTLVLFGRHDWVCPPAASRTLATTIPAARLVEIESAGHFPFAEEPDSFQTAVREFLADLAFAEERPSIRAMRSPADRPCACTPANHPLWTVGCSDEPRRSLP
jgi:proline iminopeptidase